MYKQGTAVHVSRRQPSGIISFLYGFAEIAQNAHSGKPPLSNNALLKSTSVEEGKC